MSGAKTEPDMENRTPLQLHRMIMGDGAMLPPAQPGRKIAVPRRRTDGLIRPSGYDSLGGDAQSETFLSPIDMKYPPHGILAPAYGEKLLSLREVRTRRKISSAQARYYQETQMETDKITAEHIFDLDGVLRADAAARSDPTVPDPSPWKLEDHLGKGGQGSVTKWSRQKPGSNIMEHLAVKDSRQGAGFDMDYNSEYYLIRRLNHRGSQNVIQVYDQGYYLKGAGGQSFFRMALEWCDLGDLGSMKKWYIANRLLLPEAFIWHVALSTAKALLYCHNGGIHKEKADDWEPIVHMDIKELNVLLKTPEDSNTPYPDIKIADFGCGFALPNDEISSYKSTWHTGTRKYMDPHLQMEYPRTPQSDIYSYGVMLRYLVNIYDELLGKKGAAVLHERPDLLQNANVEYYHPYSNTLRNLIERCTEHDPKYRANLWDIYQVANTEWNKHLKVLETSIKEDRETNRPFFRGGVIAGKDLQIRFKHNVELRTSVNQNNWFRLNAARISHITTAAKRLQNDMYGGFRDTRRHDSDFLY